MINRMYKIKWDGVLLKNSRLFLNILTKTNAYQ